MDQKTWKVLAIVFICLFVVETIGLIWLWTAGYNSILEENHCIDECYSIGFYDYDPYTHICHCLNGEGEVVKTIDLT